MFNQHKPSKLPHRGQRYPPVVPRSKPVPRRASLLLETGSPVTPPLTHERCRRQQRTSPTPLRRITKPNAKHNRVELEVAHRSRWHPAALLVLFLPWLGRGRECNRRRVLLGLADKARGPCGKCLGLLPGQEGRVRVEVPARRCPMVPGTAEGMSGGRLESGVMDRTRSPLVAVVAVCRAKGEMAERLPGRQRVDV